MTFLIRAAFWLSLVILLLPVEQEGDMGKSQLSTTQAVSAAQATLNDFTSFCARQPDACAAGEVALENFAAKARYGAKQLYLYLDGVSGDGDSAETTELAQNSISSSEGQEAEQQQLTAMVRELQ